MIVIGYLFAAFLILLGLGAGSRQLVTLARVRAQPYMAEEDRGYFRGQAHRRMLASGLLVVIGAKMIAHSHVHISHAVSLGVIAGILAVGVAASIISSRREEPKPAEPSEPAEQPAEQPVEKPS